MRAEAANEAAARRDDAEGVFEAARTKAAQAAAQFEVSLANRRDHAERDLATRQEAAQRHLRQTSDQADQLRLEAQKLRDETERRSRQLLDTAQQEAEDIMTEGTAAANCGRHAPTTPSLTCLPHGSRAGPCWAARSTSTNRPHKRPAQAQ